MASGRMPGSTIPRGVAVDRDGNVYVADDLNETIRLVTPDGVVSTIAGSPGVPGTADGPAGTAQFYNPSSLGFDSGGLVHRQPLEQYDPEDDARRGGVDVHRHPWGIRLRRRPGREMVKTK